MKNSLHVIDYWNRIAEKWRFIGSPLRPCPEDLREMQKGVRGWIAAHPGVPPRCLILGVTPEFVKMDWPAGTRMTAVDGSPIMIQKVWPGYPGPGQGAICANWHNLRLPEASVDIVLGDGCFTVITLPRGRELLRSVTRVLSHEGILVARFFVRPERTERPEAVMADLLAGRIGSFDAFKWRLVMAHYDKKKGGVHLQQVWDFWHNTGLDAGSLAKRLDCLPESVATIDLYQGIDDYYSFPTLAQLRSVLEEECAVITCYIPSYELGERCPIYILRQK